MFFVVGNHEMWTGSRKRRTEEGGEGGGDGDAIDSVEKLVQMHRMCEVGWVVLGCVWGGGGIPIVEDTSHASEGRGKKLVQFYVPGKFCPKNGKIGFFGGILGTVPSG